MLEPTERKFINVQLPPNNQGDGGTVAATLRQVLAELPLAHDFLDKSNDRTAINIQLDDNDPDAATTVDHLMSEYRARVGTQTMQSLIFSKLPQYRYYVPVEEVAFTDVEHAAYIFASAAHAAIDQRRKYTNEPYIVHPVVVYSLVMAVGGSTEQLAAALLHDVVEDTAVTIETIEQLFGAKIGKLVSELTDVSKPEDGTRKVRKELDRQHTAQSSPEAKTIKLADLIANTLSIVEHDPDFAVVYLKEKDLLLDVLQEGHPTLFNLASELLRKAQMEIALRPK